MQILLRILIPLVILVTGFFVSKWLGKPIEPPVPEARERQKLRTEKLVLNPSNYRVVIETQGAIRARQETFVTPLVPGTILRIGENFEDGAFFREGEVLVELDPADLKTSLLAADSRLARAEAALIQERARGSQARANWNDIGYSGEPSPLVLRVPQLREAEANVSAARADVEQAQRNLERAKIRAPFDGRVKRRMIGLGQAVTATTQFGEVFATATAEVRLPLAPAQLPFIDLPTRADEAAVVVTLTDALADPAGPAEHQWVAKILRTEGTLDETSRELFAIAEIEDPFSLNSDLPELRIGQPVRAAISGIKLKDVYVIPRTAMRGLDRIYLIDKEEPKIIRTDISPVWSNSEVVIVRNGINPGDWLAISRLPFAPNLAPVEIFKAPPAGESAGSASEVEAVGS